MRWSVGWLPLIVAAGLAAQEDRLVLKDTSLKVSLEQVMVHEGHPRMGLMRLGYFQELEHGFNAGLTIFGPVRGVDGGALAIGLEGGYRRALTDRLQLSTGLSVGGGAGYPGQWDGHGLMLRYYGGLAWKVGKSAIGLDLSHVTWPGGTVHSTQLALSWEHHFGSFRFEGHPTGWSRPKLEALLPEGTAFHVGQGFVEFLNQRYSAPGGMWGGDYRLPGTYSVTPQSYIGLRFGYGPDRSRFVFLEGAGGSWRQSDLYNEVLLGIGARYFFGPSDRMALRGTLAAGTGGAGGLHTGGGLVTKAEVGLEVYFAGKYLGVDVGRVVAPGSPLKAQVVGLRLGTTFGTLEPGPSERAWEGGELDLAKMRVRTVFMRYETPQHSNRAMPMEPVGHLGFAVDSLFNDYLYATGQVGLAVSGRQTSAGGDAGWGYAMLGGGVQTPLLFGRNRLLLDGTVGMGGGAMSVNDSPLIQVMGGWLYEGGKTWGIQLMGGRIKATGGRLNTATYSLGLVVKGSYLTIH